MRFLGYDTLFMTENFENKGSGQNRIMRVNKVPSPRPNYPRTRPPLQTHPPPTLLMGNRPQMLSCFLCTPSRAHSSQVISARPQHCY